MSDFIELLERSARKVREEGMVPFVEEDMSKGFRPIPDLKAGEQVRWKGREYICNKWPKEGESVTVYSTDVGNFLSKGEEGKPVERSDFSVLFFGEGVVMEFAYDSRRFERVPK